MASGQAPDSFRDMHRRLDSLGVVSLVTAALRSNREVVRVDNLLCWVEVDDGAVCVKASYIKIPGRVPGRSTAPHEDRASFRVEQGEPFGPITAAPLPRQTVAAIYGMVGRTA